MLSPDILKALMAYADKIVRPVTLVVQTGEHSKRAELIGMLKSFVTISDLLSLVEADAGLRSPVSFQLEVDGQPNGVMFSGIPGGHEFNSLVLAVLNAGGHPVKLDESLKDIIRSINEPLRFEVFVGLSCHNCPDVVQALNQFAQLNPGISSEMIDGALYKDEVEARNVQGVPAVFLNGKPFANGKIDTAGLLDKLKAKFSVQAQPAQALPLQDVTVIGGGPAGVSAAIYAARKGLKVTLVTDRIGGQVKDTQDIENLISVPKTTGNELSAALQQHMQDYEISLREHLRVDRVEPGDTKALHLSTGEVIRTRTLVIATGAKWRELGVPGERENIGQGVAYCPHCDGPFFKGRDVAVIGGGNSGIEAALDLSGIVRQVTVFEFMPELKADQVLVNQAEQRDNIRIIRNAAVNEILAADNRVHGLRYQDRGTGDTLTQDLAAVFVQIGLSPNSDFVDGLVDRTPQGEIIIDERGRTSAEGIFACGDVTTVPYKQIVIAMGEGAKAALAAFEHLLMQPAGGSEEIEKAA
jgi:alkyl hydroperoxide reductase subunit F